MIAVVFLATLILGIVALLAADRLLVLHFTLLAAVPVILGSTVLPTHLQPAAALHTLAFVVLLCAYAIGRLGQSQSQVVDAPTEQEPSRRYAPYAVSIVALGCAYHFSVVGVPVLQTGVEVTRFQFGDSGLAGIPSRMYLFGTFICIAVAVAEAKRRGIPFYKDGWCQVAIVTLLLTRLASGFKSGLLQVAIYILLILVLSGMRISLARNFKVLGAATVAIVGFMYFVGSTYKTYNASGKSLTELLLQRAFYESAQPSALLFSLNGYELRDPRAILQIDWQYFLPRYTAIGEESRYSFGRLFSGYLFGIPPDPDRIIAPVTTGASAEAYYDFGFAGLFIVSLILGYLLARSEVFAAKRSGDVWQFTGAAVACRALLDFQSKGGLIYTAFNWTATLVFIFFLAVVSERLLAARKTQEEPVSRSTI